MFERIIFFYTTFSRFVVALASQDGFQIRFFNSFFENVGLVKIRTKHWLCAEISRFVLKKITGKSIQQRAQRRYREKRLKYRF